MTEATEIKTTLAEQVRLIQEREGSTDQEFAEILGIDKTYLGRFYRGEREAGRKLLVGLSRRYPELAPWITLYLQGEIPSSAKQPIGRDKPDGQKKPNSKSGGATA